MTPLAIMGLSIQELLVIMGIIVLLFGARKLPDLARAMGRSVRELRSGLKEEDEDGQNKLG